MRRWIAVLPLFIFPGTALADNAPVRLNDWTIRPQDKFRCIAYNAKSVAAPGSRGEEVPERTRFVVVYGLNPEYIGRDKPFHTFEILIANPTWKDLPSARQASGDDVIILLSGTYDISIKLHGSHQRISEPDLNLRGWGYALKERAIGAPDLGLYIDATETTTNDLKNIGDARTMTVSVSGTSLGQYQFVGWEEVADELQRCVNTLQSETN